MTTMPLPTDLLRRQSKLWVSARKSDICLDASAKYIQTTASLDYNWTWDVATKSEVAKDMR